MKLQGSGCFAFRCQRNVLLAEVHEGLGNLGAGGVLTGRDHHAVQSGGSADGERPLHGLHSVLVDGGGVGVIVQLHAVRHVIALVLGITVQDGGQLLAEMLFLSEMCFQQEKSEAQTQVTPSMSSVQI